MCSVGLLYLIGCMALKEPWPQVDALARGGKGLSPRSCRASLEVRNSSRRIFALNGDLWGSTGRFSSWFPFLFKRKTGSRKSRSMMDLSV
mmetsp:Transcript_39626/g.33475  ORF Transcript_39626/g.33475 Transcript_39626/m.33475 type:complete len:90 (+) Transcript_39626:711-980(+)